MKKIKLSELKQEELEVISGKLSDEVEQALDSVKKKLDKKLAKYGLKIELSCTIQLEDENQGGLNG